MPISLKSFDEKIAELKEKKKALELKHAQQLIKYISSEVGDKFSPALAACVIQDSWSTANKDKQEKWLKAAEKFQFSKPRKTLISNIKESETASAA